MEMSSRAKRMGRRMSRIVFANRATLSDTSAATSAACLTTTLFLVGRVMAPFTSSKTVQQLLGQHVFPRRQRRGSITAQSITYFSI